MFKKSVTNGEAQGIQYVLGKVRFQSFQLSVFCFETDGVLIDTGAYSLSKQLKPFFDEIDIDKVVITHDHEDHTGGAAYIQKTKGVPIFMSNKSAKNGEKPAKYPLYRKAFWGSRKPFEAQPIGETFESRNATWDVIETPGHAYDHLAFYNRQTGQMFTGDLYVSPITKVILKSESIPTIVRSLDHVLSYDFNEIVCNHAGIVSNGREALLEKKRNLETFIDQVLTLHQQGVDGKEIHARLIQKKYPITRFSSGEWDSLHMVTSILDDESLFVK
jgi:endoribonuclease LACTB2